MGKAGILHMRAYSIITLIHFEILMDPNCHCEEASMILFVGCGVPGLVLRTLNVFSHSSLIITQCSGDCDFLCFTDEKTEVQGYSEWWSRF